MGAVEELKNFQTPPDPRDRHTDVANAERLVKQRGQDLKYVPTWGWMTWDGAIWRCDEMQAQMWVMDMARSIHTEAADEPDTSTQKMISSWAQRSQNKPRIAAALWCARSMLAAGPEEFDRDPLLLPVQNGTVDLRTGSLRPHHRDDLCTSLAPVEFDSKKSCPEWHKFLDRIFPDPEVRDFVRRAAGYSLTGSTAEQVFFFAYGTGRNGKSVFIETLATLLGRYHKATRVETLSGTTNRGVPNDVAALAGARLVTVSETPEDVRLNEPLVKDLTGGDTLQARFLHREFFDFRPQLKLWVRGNHKPAIRGTDEGIWRRVVLVPFASRIQPEEVDPHLAERLQEELPGILNWALEGCLEWQEHGLCPPAAVCQAVEGYRAEMDVLGAFLDECCQLGADQVEQTSRLYRRYCIWCDTNGESPLNQHGFGRKLAERGFEKEKKGTIHWRGLRLVGQQG